MRVLAIRVETEEQDRDAARVVLRTELAHPAKTVMVIRGRSPNTTHLADRAGARSDGFPWREVVWVQDAAIFVEGQEEFLFGANPVACAVVLDFDDRPILRLDATASLLDIERAFLSAQSGGDV